MADTNLLYPTMDIVFHNKNERWYSTKLFDLYIKMKILIKCVFGYRLFC